MRCSVHRLSPKCYLLVLVSCTNFVVKVRGKKEEEEDCVMTNKGEPIIDCDFVTVLQTDVGQMLFNVKMGDILEQ